MNLFEKVMDDLEPRYTTLARQMVAPIVEFEQKMDRILELMKLAKEEYQTTGAVSDATYAALGGDVAARRRDSAKENKAPARSRRNAFKEASQSIAGGGSLSTKQRRAQNPLDDVQNVQVKVEKLSIAPQVEEEALEEDVQVKVEKEEMPAPTKPAPKRRKKKTEVKVEVKQEKIDDSPVRPSDVVIQDVTITTINLLDGSDDERQSDKQVEQKKDQEPRTTRARTKQKKQIKRSRTSSSEEEPSNNNNNIKKDINQSTKRSKSNEDFEDAMETLTEENNTAANCTYVAKPAETTTIEQMNSTVVVQNPKLVVDGSSVLAPKTVDELMTDDESFDEKQKPKKVKEIKELTKPGRAIPKPIKQVFSPFEQSPVKKKVQAFEKYYEETTATVPPRQTRTKTRLQAKQQAESETTTTAPQPPNNGNVKEKAKIFTPMTSRFLPKAASTTVKSNPKATSAANVSSSNESLLSAKSASALKASQAEYRERERKRREKEEEAVKKREALIQAQTEEKRRKREEKMQKVQLQKEALEREKMKAFEAQRLKDERHKQLIAEQEEKKQRVKEEAEKKRKLAKLRAVEEKKKEEERKKEEEKKVEEMSARLASQGEVIARMLQDKKELKKAPMYMRTRAPRLPTPDCYDSDEEGYDEKALVPPWAQERSLRLMQKCETAAGETIKNTFFVIQAQTADLQEIFEVIAAKKLKRSSSAMWHKPPRFTMMPNLQSHDETEEFDDFE